MSDERVGETAERAEFALARAEQVRERVSRLNSERRANLKAAQEAAGEARKAAVAALRFSSEAHARKAGRHRDFAAVLEDRGETARAERHRQAAVAEQEAAAKDLRRLASYGGAPQRQKR